MIITELQIFWYYTTDVTHSSSKGATDCPYMKSRFVGAIPCGCPSFGNAVRNISYTISS